jgi:hypothetical protein
MAILTYDPTPADQPELNEAEQEALAIGEQRAQEESRMLAGKYESAEELEKAYIELQKKLGESNDGLREEDPQGRRREEEVEEQPIDADPLVDLLNEASQEYAQEGKLTEETFEKLSQMDSKDLLEAYMQIQSNPAQVEDFTAEQVTEIQNFVGGEEQYNGLVSWAAENMPENFVQAFDNLINVGDPDMIKLAVVGMQAAFQEANGYEGRMLSGKPAQTQQDVFRSQAEVVAAMSDPRYDRDPAYRQDVFAKLERSDLNY